MTYNGLGLYRYAPDTKTGETKGQALFKAWYVIAPSGKIVKQAAAAAPAASTPPPTDTTPPDGGGGYDYG